MILEWRSTISQCGSQICRKYESLDSAVIYSTPVFLISSSIAANNCGSTFDASGRVAGGGPVGFRHLRTNMIAAARPTTTANPGRIQTVELKPPGGGVESTFTPYRRTKSCSME